MSLRTAVGIGVLAVLGSPVGVFYWLHARGEQHVPEVVSPEPPVSVTLRGLKNRKWLGSELNSARRSKDGRASR